ncbi:GIY-YIG nuclease family protein [Vibrio cortegadensis]|uniref:GIY-YIG nuclease family protein n=1 Tax=Vibrio cortegadensis TaxID=1328770 RepID=UPI0021C314BA|nr:GIY-YIG nuclease family protein [Vibrio cortegadensis]MDN3698353.1 GIY-YIG nuclease family protein [Vibrio cortegadensis]
MEVITKLIEIPIFIDRVSIALIDEYSKVSIRRTTSKKDTRLRVYIDSIFVGRFDTITNELVYQHVISNRKVVGKVTTATYHYRPDISIQITLVGALKENRNQTSKLRHNRGSKNNKVTPENRLKKLENELQELDSISGIYRIYNNISGKSYIGQTVNLKRRLFSEHLNNLIQGKHTNLALQHDWNVKPDSISIEVLASGIPLSDLDKLEAQYIDKYHSYTYGYNQTFDGQRSPRFAETEELVLEFSYANRRELDV